MNKMMQMCVTGALAITLCGCTFSLRDMGQSTEANRAAQTIYADPVDDTVSPSFDGAKAGPVLEKYRRADTRASDQPLLRNVTN